MDVKKSSFSLPYCDDCCMIRRSLVLKPEAKGKCHFQPEAKGKCHIRPLTFDFRVYLQARRPHVLEIVISVFVVSIACVVSKDRLIRTLAG